MLRGRHFSLTYDYYRYCSDACGVHHMSSLMQDRGMDVDQIEDHVKNACQPEAYIQDHANASGKRIECAASALHRRNADALEEQSLLHERKQALEHRVRVAEDKQTVLENALRLTEELPDLEVLPEEAMEVSKKKGKKTTKAKSGNLADERRPCGFNAVILSDDSAADNTANMTILRETAGRQTICLEPRRKCARHTGQVPRPISAFRSSN